jgi:hypothetical protein
MFHKCDGDNAITKIDIILKRCDCGLLRISKDHPVQEGLSILCVIELENFIFGTTKT